MTKLYLLCIIDIDKLIMKSILNKLSIAITTVVVSLSLASPVFAVALNPCDTLTDPWKKLCDIQEDDLGSIVGQAVLLIFVVATLIALFFLIWGGVKWIMSGGDKGKVESARSTIIAALIGLVVTFLSFFILSLILGIFGLNLGNLEIPNLI